MSTGAAERQMLALIRCQDVPNFTLTISKQGGVFLVKTVDLNTGAAECGNGASFDEAWLRQVPDRATESLARMQTGEAPAPAYLAPAVPMRDYLRDWIRELTDVEDRQGDSTDRAERLRLAERAAELERLIHGNRSETLGAFAWKLADILSTIEDSPKLGWLTGQVRGLLLDAVSLWARGAIPG